jgi:putative transposase
MAESLRFTGKVLSATISREASWWFISILVDVPDVPECSENQVHSAVGIDLGVSHLLTLSDGHVFENQRTTKRFERRLRRLNKSLARKKKGSRNWKKAKLRLSRLHYRIRCTRKDYLHKVTRWIADGYSDVCVEDLNAKGMVRNRRLVKSISDASFGAIVTLLEQKAIRVHKVDRFFPSTKLCPKCGQLNEMPLHRRIYICDCGYGPIDRDLHAAQNVLRAGCPEVKPVETEALAGASLVPVKLLSVKQEINVNLRG